ncbi:peptide deformylase [Shewanella aestuarii]|uniref:Peptide deformylase n=1 Tax=Shewanella aestuarii TaxID=1028752 RepID=A0A6G9QLV2_9GAMM|nr:peptide deformylase [Shewanella aestuarii]QIR15560.1 peptide deformylase [Shewanella aestuarii]
MSNSGLMPIATTGDAILTKAAIAVTVFDDELAKLAEKMMLTMTTANGVGIAAPQVFSPLAMFIMASKPNARYPLAPRMEPVVVVNPRIINTSEHMECAEEGCLSIPSKRLSIWRHQQITVQYQNIAGKVIHQALDGFVARIFQHEYDHLQGITLLERSQMPEQTVMLM